MTASASDARRRAFAQFGAAGCGKRDC